MIAEDVAFTIEGCNNLDRRLHVVYTREKSKKVLQLIVEGDNGRTFGVVISADDAAFLIKEIIDEFGFRVEQEAVVRTVVR